jgi:hypothetical protein
MYTRADVECENWFESTAVQYFRKYLEVLNLVIFSFTRGGLISIADIQNLVRLGPLRCTKIRGEEAVDRPALF